MPELTGIEARRERALEFLRREDPCRPDPRPSMYQERLRRSFRDGYHCEECKAYGLSLREAAGISPEEGAGR